MAKRKTPPESKNKKNIKRQGEKISAVAVSELTSP